MKKNQLPLSIKFIGWYFILIAILIVVVALFLVLGTHFLHTFFKTEGSISAFNLILFLAILIALVPFLVGFGILRKNMVAWYMAVIISGLGILHLILRPDEIKIFLLPINAIITWFLIKHRQIFGI